MPLRHPFGQMPHQAVTHPFRQAAEAAGLYILLCITYIFVSGLLASHVAKTSQQLYVIETIKGSAFIVVTGVLFFAISFLRLSRIKRQEETIIMHEKGLLQAERRRVAAMSAAAIAHDLNNLLMALSGFVEEIKGRKREDSSLHARGDAMDVGIDNLRRLAKRLASAVSLAVPEKAEEVDVKAALNELVAVVRKHPVALFCRISTSEVVPLTLSLNRSLFEEAVLNLLINAAEATGSEGKIDLSLTIDGGSAILAIHDDGPGVPDDLIKDIFEPCFTTKPTGTGLGLLSVQAFAESCGGEISVSRSPLGGALFQIRIPLQNHPADKFLKSE